MHDLPFLHKIPWMNNCISLLLHFSSTQEDSLSFIDQKQLQHCLKVKSLTMGGSTILPQFFLVMKVG